METTLAEIYNFRTLGGSLGTSGQPSKDQFRIIHDAAFEAVINLALPTSDNAVADEGAIITELGMCYLHLPVDFKAPSSRDFDTFCRLMNAFEGRRVFVHCVANMRVSAFLFLYRVLYQHADLKEAKQEMHSIWQPDLVWSRFLEHELKRGRSEGKSMVG
jgi:protein tyrosine phosphatase (PTP) superfamily phosphohydrolase (DUF442 family)